MRSIGARTRTPAISRLVARARARRPRSARRRSRCRPCRSRSRARSRPAPRRARRPTAPPAGPESSAFGPRKRAASVRPPDDCMKRSARAGQRRAERCDVTRAAAASGRRRRTAVSPRASMPSSRATSCERDHVREARLARERRDALLQRRVAIGVDAERPRPTRSPSRARRARAPRAASASSKALEHAAVHVAAARQLERARVERRRLLDREREQVRPLLRADREQVAEAALEVTSSVRAPRRSSSALVASVVPSCTVARRQRRARRDRRLRREQRRDRLARARRPRTAASRVWSAPSGATAMQSVKVPPRSIQNCHSFK